MVYVINATALIGAPLIQAICFFLYIFADDSIDNIVSMTTERMKPWPKKHLPECSRSESQCSLHPCQTVWSTLLSSYSRVVHAHKSFKCHHTCLDSIIILGIHHSSSARSFRIKRAEDDQELHAFCGLRDLGELKWEQGHTLLCRAKATRQNHKTCCG